MISQDNRTHVRVPNEPVSPGLLRWSIRPGRTVPRRVRARGASMSPHFDTVPLTTEMSSGMAEARVPRQSTGIRPSVQTTGRCWALERQPSWHSVGALQMHAQWGFGKVLALVGRMGERRGTMNRGITEPHGLRNRSDR